MLHSYVKLNRELNLKTLCESIKFVPPKALFMIEKVTSFLRVFNVFRANYQAKLEELVYPFVHYHEHEPSLEREGAGPSI